MGKGSVANEESHSSYSLRHSPQTDFNHSLTLSAMRSRRATKDSTESGIWLIWTDGTDGMVGPPKGDMGSAGATEAIIANLLRAGKVHRAWLE